MTPTPIELLQNYLNGLKRNLTRSEEMLEDGVIDEKLHLIHKCNLLPKIGEYQLAIYQILEIEKKNFLNKKK